MIAPEMRWIAEGAPSEEEAILSVGPIDEAKRRAFDAKWVSAQEARVAMAMAAGSRSEAVEMLVEAMAGGLFRTRGVPLDSQQRHEVQRALDLPEQDDFQPILIHPSFWAEATDQDRSRWNWPSGQFFSTPADSSTPAAYFGVQFPAFEIEALCADNGLSVPTALLQSSPSAKRAKKGGRPSGKHGEPIARTTIWLYEMDDGFGSFTSDALAVELGEAYRRADVQAPGEDNLLEISRGILRVVREERAERKSEYRPV